MKFNKRTLALAALGEISLASAVMVPEEGEEPLSSEEVKRPHRSHGDRPQRLPGDVGLMIEQAGSSHSRVRAVRHTPEEAWCGIGFTHPSERGV